MSEVFTKEQLQSLIDIIQNHGGHSSLLMKLIREFPVTVLKAAGKYESQLQIVLDAYKNNGKIHAIKMLRDWSREEGNGPDLGLKEAKDIVDEIEARYSLRS